jgi:hypothetical protein
MILGGLIKHQCPFRAVAAAVSSTPIIAQLPFLPFLSERSSVGCFGEVCTACGFSITRSYRQVGVDAVSETELANSRAVPPHKNSKNCGTYVLDHAVNRHNRASPNPLASLSISLCYDKSRMSEREFTGGLQAILPGRSDMAGSLCAACVSCGACQSLIQQGFWRSR